MISDLNAMPEELIEELRGLAGIRRLAVLRSHVTTDNFAALETFCRDVLDGGTPAREWGRGGMLVPEWSLPELVVMSVAEILAPLGKPDVEGWFHLKPKEHMVLGDFYSGAPVVLRPDLHYSWHAPEGVARLRWDESRVLPTDDVSRLTRRWIAYRAAQMRPGEPFPVGRKDALARQFNVVADSISDDALRALCGLNSELTARGPETPQPGFRGPDSDYA